jgi:hypothetical protein
MPIKALARLETKVNSEWVSTYRDKLLTACQAEIKPKSQPPDVVYHLTDSDALLSIVGSRCLRASLVTTLNDSLEVRYGIDLAVRLLQEQLKSQASFYDFTLLQYLRDPSSAPKEFQFEFAPFVVSFCGRPEKSGQWLHYGRSGHGVAIGFSSSIAKAVRYDLFQVDYTPKSQEERILRLFRTGASVIEAHGQRSDKKEQAVVVAMTAHLISLYTRILAVGLKHPSFSDEDEWRMVAHGISYNGKSLENGFESREVMFRTSCERIVPYEELNFGSSESGSIKEVILGYSSALSVEAIRLLTLKYGDDVLVSRSEVPVR